MVGSGESLRMRRFSVQLRRAGGSDRRSVWVGPVRVGGISMELIQGKVRSSEDATVEGLSLGRPVDHKVATTVPTVLFDAKTNEIRYFASLMDPTTENKRVLVHMIFLLRAAAHFGLAGAIPKVVFIYGEKSSGPVIGYALEWVYANKTGRADDQVLIRTSANKSYSLAQLTNGQMGVLNGLTLSLTDPNLMAAVVAKIPSPIYERFRAFAFLMGLWDTAGRNVVFQFLGDGSVKIGRAHV